MGFIKVTSPPPQSEFHTAPDYEKIIFGSLNGFTDSLQVNLEFLEKKVNHRYFRVQTIEIGTDFKQSVALVYLENKVHPEVLEYLGRRIREIQTEPLFGIGQLEQWIKGFPMSPFAGFQATRLPDLAKVAVSQGKVLILLEGYPTALNGPTDFFSFFQMPDDPNLNWLLSSLLQFFRLMAMTVAVFIPAFYVAVISFHYYILPLNIIAPLVESRIRVPFSPIIEMLLLESIMEILREGALRRGNTLALATGGVGLLLAVAGALITGFFSPFSIMLSGITLLATLILPVRDMSQTIRLLKYGALLLTGVFGILGAVVFASLITVHLLVLESAGQPYFQPIALLRKKWAEFLAFCNPGALKKAGK